MIHRFDKIPMVFKTDEFVRTVFLYDQGLGKLWHLKEQK